MGWWGGGGEWGFDVNFESIQIIFIVPYCSIFYFLYMKKVLRGWGFSN